jgi:2-amino-4-hydroxy-6-hydroxymethyldihydropteridine diphosphokinase
MARLAAHHIAFVSVGSNLGDKLGNCLKGIAALADSGHNEVVGVSRFFRTSPVDYTQQDWFVNAAVKIKTALDPTALLDELVSIQRRAGRKAGAIRFGPRVLDLDILLYDALVMHAPQLEIPHPRMHKRAFVLRPICDIEPAVIHPVLGKSAADLLENLDDEAQQVIALENQPILSKGRLP